MKIKEIINYLEKRFPIDNAEDFDKPRIGLIVGSSDIELTNILMSLDLSKDVALDAVNKNCNLIIVHHPFFFEPMHKVLFDSLYGQVIEILFKHHISVFAMHTNLDVGVGGVNDVLAELLGIKNYKIANDSPTKSNYLRYGNIEEMSLEKLAYYVKDKLNIPGVRILGDLNKKINVIGVVGGSGAHQEDIENAKKFGCDCLITGEVKLNNAQYANFLGLSILEVNHGIEKNVFYSLRNEMINDLNLKCNVIVTDVNTDPLQHIIK